MHTTPRNGEILESHEASITYEWPAMRVINKRTGKKMEAITVTDKTFHMYWRVKERPLEMVPEESILMQIDMYESCPGEYIDMRLMGYKAKDLEEELEIRKKAGSPLVTERYQEALAYMLKKLGLPTYETLRRHKRQNG